MAFTRVQELDQFDAGNGGSDDGSPKYWHEDILLLINEENPQTIVERNVIFQGNELTALMSGHTTHLTMQNMIVVKCPPYFKPLEERFKNDSF